MNGKQFVVIGLAGVACAVSTAIALAGTDERQKSSTGLVREVRRATEDFRDVRFAIADGYGSSGSCVTGPQEGAMGIHYINGPLVGDGELKANSPEILMYEQRGGRLRLLGVEYLVIAEDWHENNEAPPVLLGQHFQYVGSPNRYGLPPFYELHVWAWRDNANGMFVDWNPTVSCEEYTAEEATSSTGHAH